MKKLNLVLSVVGILSASFAHADSVFEPGAGSTAWTATDMIDPQGNSLSAMEVQVTSIEPTADGKYLATADSVATDQNGAPLCARIRLSLEASSVTIASLSAGVLIGPSNQQNCPSGIMAVGLKGLEIRGELGITGYGGAVGYGVSLGTLPGYGGATGYFVGLGFYHPVNSPGAFLGRNGNNYVGPVADLYVAGLKLGLGYLFKMPGGPGGGADFIFRLNLGVGI